MNATKSFIHENFLLDTPQAIQLYHEYASPQPIIDYHSHLDPKLIAEEHAFSTITEAWLAGDHYKWRAMRMNGINERTISGDASDFEKFESWASTVPYTIKNPLFHWTHLELAKPFKIFDLLTPVNAKTVYDNCNRQLKDNWNVTNLLDYHKVKIACTTDDPSDSLEHHIIINGKNGVKVYPTFRPDKAIKISNDKTYRDYLMKLGISANYEIKTYSDLLAVLKIRHQAFHQAGCRLSDHGIENLTFTPVHLEMNADKIFSSVLDGKEPTSDEKIAVEFQCLLEIAQWNSERGWVQQWHIGAVRNTNTRYSSLIGADAGTDSIGSSILINSLALLFDVLDRDDRLAKTIIYNLNPSDNYSFATMAGNFSGGGVAGKIQFGAAWWFNDQKSGIEAHLDVLSNTGLLSRFVGMLTDSRSFLSYSRHEYFRRILCNVLGHDLKKGLIPNDSKLIGKMIEAICYRNAENYFSFE